MAVADNCDIIIVVTTLPDQAAATRLAALLVEEHRAACVNILSGCTSVFRWEGEVRTATEVPLLIKSSFSEYSRIEQTIRAHHPYEVPEILSIPVVDGFPAYLNWVHEESTPE